MDSTLYWFDRYGYWISAIFAILFWSGVIFWIRKKIKQKKKNPEPKKSADTRFRFFKRESNASTPPPQTAPHDSDSPYVFISYESGERCIADQLIREVLQANHVAYWIAPDYIPAGSSYAAEIEQAIKHCSAFLLVLSSKAMRSQWVEKELDRALFYNRIIIPFQIEPCELTQAFQFYLSNVQRISAISRLQDRFETLVKQLRGILPE